MAACPSAFTAKKEAKEEMVGLCQDRGFVYLTMIALLMQVVFNQARITPFDFFQAFLASLIYRQGLWVKASLVILVSLIFLFF